VWVMVEEAFFLSFLLMKVGKWIAVVLMGLWFALRVMALFQPASVEFPFTFTWFVGIWVVVYCFLILIGTYVMYTDPHGRPLGWLLYMVFTGGIATLALLVIGLVVAGSITLVAWFIVPQFNSLEVLATVMVPVLFGWHHVLRHSNLGGWLRELSTTRVYT
jgi:hypothetical protein